MRDRSFCISLVASVLLHAGLVAGVCAFGYSYSNPGQIVFNVEITSEPPAALGPGGGSGDSVQVFSAPAVQLGGEALGPVALKPEMVSLKPAVRKTAPKAIPAATTQQERPTESSAQQGGILRGDGYGSADGFGSLSGVPGGTGTGGGAQIQLISAPKPPFPRAARRDGFEGKAVFNVLVSAEGDLREVKVHKGSGREDCDEAALETIRERWRFAAAMMNGQPVSAWGRVSVRYQLQ